MNRVLTLTLMSLFVLFAIACSGDDAQPDPDATAPEAATTDGGTALTVTALRNGTYPNEFAEDGTATLKDGVFTGPRVGLYKDDVPPPLLTVSMAGEPVFGSLPNSLSGPDAEAALILMSKTEGTTGTFYELLAVRSDGGEPVAVAHTPLGDRVIIKSLTIQDGAVLVQMTVSGPDDPACCLTRDLTRGFELVGDQLVEK